MGEIGEKVGGEEKWQKREIEEGTERGEEREVREERGEIGKKRGRRGEIEEREGRKERVLWIGREYRDIEEERSREKYVGKRDVEGWI